MAKNFLVVIVILTFSLWVSGCATIVHGTSTNVSINTDPEGATASSGGKSTTTPGHLLMMNNKPEVIQFEKEGYQPSSLYLEQGMSGWLWGNILLGFSGLIGLFIDFISGGAYKLSPKEVHVTLRPKI